MYLLSAGCCGARGGRFASLSRRGTACCARGASAAGGSAEGAPPIGGSPLRDSGDACREWRGEVRGEGVSEAFGEVRGEGSGEHHTQPRLPQQRSVGVLVRA